MMDDQVDFRISISTSERKRRREVGEPERVRRIELLLCLDVTLAIVTVVY